ncbi:MAG: dipeptidase [Elusimicrobiota bacterium]
MKAPVFDLHCDAILKAVHKKVRLLDDNPVSQVDVPKMRRGDVDGVFLSLWADPVFKGPDSVKRTSFMLDRALKEIEHAGEHMRLALRGADLAASTDAGRIVALLGIEGGPSIDGRLANLEEFHRRGVRRMTLVCTQSTDWAGSTGDDGRNRGLSALGKDIVQAMNELGMAVDVAHSCERTLLDAAKISRKPIICSHSLSRAVVRSERLASDEMICAVKATGGVFGITFLPTLFAGEIAARMSGEVEEMGRRMNAGGAGETLEEKADDTARILMDSPAPAEIPHIRDVLPHVDHVIDLIGEDHVGIGTDYDSMSFAPRGLEDVSRFDTLRQAMSRHGYGDERIRKILGGNVRRVLPRILPR